VTSTLELLEAIRSPSDWMSQGACRGKDPMIFFPTQGGSLRPARDICRECMVREQCLEYAVYHAELDGVWAGTCEGERRQIRRRRGIYA
jgi:WhiB family transcriptional regulator, redox-sensing transcriptional regulator